MIIFLCFCFFEYRYSKKHSLNIYKDDQILSHLSNGLGQIAINSVFMLFIMKAYIETANNYALFKINNNNLFCWILAIFLSDFLYYVAHRFGHRVNLVIGIHYVHHQAQDYNLLSAFRLPWLNRFILILFFIPMPFIGFTTEMLMLAMVLNSFVATLAHIGVFKKNLGIIEYILVTPRSHYVHHGVNDIYRDKNFGGIFIIWDRLFETYQELRDDIPLVLPSNNEGLHESPIVANTSYYFKILGALKKSKSFSEKLKIVFGTPEYLECFFSKETSQNTRPQINLKKGLFLVSILMCIIQFLVVIGKTEEYSMTTKIGVLGIVLLLLSALFRISKAR